MKSPMICEHCNQPIRSDDAYGLLYKGKDPRVMHNQCFADAHQERNKWERLKLGRLVPSRPTSAHARQAFINGLVVFVPVVLITLITNGFDVLFYGSLSLLIWAMLIFAPILLWLLARYIIGRQQRKWDPVEEQINATGVES